MSASVLILGCGYTGRRVAALLADEGRRVVGTSRDPQKLADLQGVGALGFDALTDDAGELPSADVLVYSIPTLRTGGAPKETTLDEPAPRLVERLQGRYGRAIYLSTTGVYGAQENVDETTPIAPATERQRLRAAAEQAFEQADWPALILRPAAIYGPGRGVQVALPKGQYKLVGDGGNFVSRIHVDDLAAVTAAAVDSDLTGAYPVADADPSTSRDIAYFVADLIGCPPPESVALKDVSETRRSNRRADGSYVFSRLGVQLKYPSFRQGVPASLDL